MRPDGFDIANWSGALASQLIVNWILGMPGTSVALGLAWAFALCIGYSCGLRRRFS